VVCDLDFSVQTLCFSVSLWLIIPGQHSPQRHRGTQSLHREEVQLRTRKKRGGFCRPPRQTIPTGGKGYSTAKSIEHPGVAGNVRYRTGFFSKQTPNNVKQLIFVPGSHSSDIPFLTGPFIVLTFKHPSCIANKMTLVRQRRVLIPLCCAG